MTDDELNRLMAEKVMGAHHVEGYKEGLWEEGDWINGSGKIYSNFHPATDANDALRVAEAMREKEWYVQIVADIFYRFVCFYRTGSDEKRVGFAYVSDIPRAICLAAAKAVGNV
jgi:hypothetical protein